MTPICISKVKEVYRIIGFTALLIAKKIYPKYYFYESKKYRESKDYN